MVFGCSVCARLVVGLSFFAGSHICLPPFNLVFERFSFNLFVCLVTTAQSKNVPHPSSAPVIR